tara:strand:- start:268 stop:489 length:222 start_codon:yes stop_codon:yes gene_type:complete
MTGSNMNKEAMSLTSVMEGYRRYMVMHPKHNSYLRAGHCVPRMRGATVDVLKEPVAIKKATSGSELISFVSSK